MSLEPSVLKFEQYCEEHGGAPAGIYKIKAYSKDGIHWILDFWFQGQIFMSLQSRSKQEVFHDFEVAKSKILQVENA